MERRVFNPFSNLDISCGMDDLRRLLPQVDFAFGCLSAFSELALAAQLKSVLLQGHWYLINLTQFCRFFCAEVDGASMASDAEVQP